MSWNASAVHCSSARDERCLPDTTIGVRAHCASAEHETCLPKQHLYTQHKTMEKGKTRDAIVSWSQSMKATMFSSSRRWLSHLLITQSNPLICLQRGVINDICSPQHCLRAPLVCVCVLHALAWSFFSYRGVTSVVKKCTHRPTGQLYALKTIEKEVCAHKHKQTHRYKPWRKQIWCGLYAWLSCYLKVLHGLSCFFEVQQIARARKLDQMIFDCLN